MAVSFAVFKTRCDLCPSEFNTTTALLRHREAKHNIDAQPVTFLPFYNGQEILRLPPTIRRGRTSLSYKQWISGIVDSINSCLHPKSAGKLMLTFTFHLCLQALLLTIIYGVSLIRGLIFYVRCLTSDLETCKLANRFEAVNVLFPTISLRNHSTR